MDIRKFTQRSVEAIQGAQSIAIEHNNQQVDEEHLLLALLTQQDSLIASLIKRMGKDDEAFTEAVRAAVERRPQITGGGREADRVYITQELDRALNAAEKQAQHMKDEYVSVEHIFLGLMEAPNDAIKALFKQFAIERNEFFEGTQRCAGRRAP